MSSPGAPYEDTSSPYNPEHPQVPETAGASRENWGTRIGVILAVTGSAVGLGNFLRFPGMAAQYGGGAFMIPYVIAFLLLGLPIALAEWSMGRAGGARGFNSAPGILRAVSRSRYGAYFGVLGPLIPIMVYMYYVFVEAWCLGYAWRYLRGGLGVTGPEATSEWFGEYVGAGANGSASGELIVMLVICFALNFFLIYRGLNKGIEFFCRYAMPALVICAIIVLVRVLTLGAPSPGVNQYHITDGLGAMWNPVPRVEFLAHVNPETGAIAEPRFNELRQNLPPELFDIRVEDGVARSLQTDDVAGLQAALRAEGWAPVRGDANVWRGGRSRLSLEFQQNEAMIRGPTFLQALANFEMWLAAAGQIFFSLSVGFGIILTYSSYVRRNEDIALSSVTAASGNQFCEVCLGGLITIPAAFAFLGPAFIAAPPGTFGMGFAALPNVFEQMPAGAFFGFLFFFLLFLAAVTSSLSMLQPAIALFEEGLGIDRKASVTILGLITLMGAGFVVYFSEGFGGIDAIDFWVGSVLIFIFATVIVILFGWVVGTEKGMEELDRGALIRLPRVIKFILKYVAPAYLLVVLGGWAYQNLPDRVSDLVRGRANVQLYAIGLTLMVALFFLFIILRAKERWLVPPGEPRRRGFEPVMEPQDPRNPEVP